MNVLSAPAKSDRPAMVIQSHRGAGELSTGNTLPAFELGWSLGLVPEADIRTAADGTIVAFHDEDFARLVKDADATLRLKSVADLPWPELARLDVGSWKGESFAGQRIPRLPELCDLLAAHPERTMYFDLKAVSLPDLAAEIRTHGVGPQITVAAPDPEVLREWKRLVPDGRTLLWMRTRHPSDVPTVETRFEVLRRENFHEISQVQIHVWMNGPLESIRRESVDPFTPPDTFLRAVGEALDHAGVLFQALPWGGATAEVYWKLLDLGVQSFATDHPLVTLEALANYRPRPR